MTRWTPRHATGPGDAVPGPRPVLATFLALILALVLALPGAMLLPALRAAAGTTPALSLSEFARDRTVFDSGAAFGRNAARVPLSGRAPPGTVIQARAVPAADPPTGPVTDPAPAGATPWQEIATADAAGTWSGRLDGLARAPGWWQVEIRAAGDPGSALRMQARFAAGHAIDIWGQSEWHRAVLPAFASLRSVEPVHDPEALQVTYVAAPGDGYGKAGMRQHAMITDATPVSSHMTALSNALAVLRPGEKFHIVFHTASGTSKADMADDSVTAPRFGRRFDDDLALHRFAYPEGEGPGLAMESWYNADSSHPDDFVPLTLRAVAGINPDGSPHVAGRNGVDHHLFPELYDPDRTVWTILGPHRFDLPAFARKIPVMRAGIAALFDPANPADVLDRTPVRFHRGLEPLTYLNGNADGSDLSHPNTGEAAGDGMHRLMRLTAAGAVEALGLAAFPVPAFDRAVPDPGGRFVDVSSTAGPVTTTRALDGGLDRLPQGQPQVWGFRHNGRRVSRADLVDGKVRVYPEGADRFAPGDGLDFASDGVGADTPDQVSRIQVWRDHPVVAIAGVPGLEGIPLRALTPQSVLGVFGGRTIPAAQTRQGQEKPGQGNPQRARQDRAQQDRAQQAGAAPARQGRGDPASLQRAGTEPAGASLLPEAVARFRPAGSGTGSGAGWSLEGSGWVTDGAGRLSAPPAADGRAQGNTGPAARGWAGRDLVLGFSMASPDGAAGQLLVAVRAQGGGSTLLWQGALPVRPGGTVTLPLGSFPADRQRMTISFQRRGAGRGTVEIADLWLKPAP